MNRGFLLPFLVSLAVMPAIPLAADVSHGQSLHASNCAHCHSTEVYTRENRRITSMGALEKQIRRCEISQGLKWFDDDINDVAAYLDENYYRFGKSK